MITKCMCCAELLGEDEIKICNRCLEVFYQGELPSFDKEENAIRMAFLRGAIEMGRRAGWNGDTLRWEALNAENDSNREG